MKDKGKDKGKDAPAKEQDAGLSLSNHPVASRHIRLAKGFGGLFGLAVVAWVTWRGGASLPAIGLRALVAGLVGYAIAWAFMLSLWRQIAIADIARRRKEAEEAYRAYLEEQERAGGGGGGDLAPA